MAKPTPKRKPITPAKPAKPAAKGSAAPKQKPAPAAKSKPLAKGPVTPAGRPVAKLAGKPVAKPPARPAPKPAAKPGAKPGDAKAAPKPVKPAAGAPAAKGAAPKPASVAPAKPGAKPSAPAVAAAPAPIPAPTGSLAAAAAAAAGKAKPKGITIVTPRPMRKPKVKKALEMPSLGAPLLGPGSKKIKPLIPSGPNVRPVASIGGKAADDARPKSPFTAKDLARYRDVLLRKRRELVGDVSKLETEALGGSSGSLSHVPQHMAEQGTETFDQSLSLDLAQVDRNLIREIDDALARIERGTFGVCEMTGKPISKERLEELPWTRFSIEAARERERRAYFRVGAPPAQSV